ncbi:unnamed protein product [Moneuplotes crassus]|uniref:PHR domain-containing protein n=1 Tax=Euplotes crassus TaxID=5936 RepID=A0AAD1XIE5_EUPCR|nr:unnamed protein product [Moneuplotes crassus]
MEEKEDIIGDKKYRHKNNAFWRVTLDDGCLPFSHIRPSIKEFTQEVLKKDAPEQFNLSEASIHNVFRSFKGKVAPVFNKGNLIYNQNEHEWYKVVDLKTDGDYTPTWASLSKNDGSESKEISDEKDFKEFKNTIKLFLNINQDNNETITLEVNPGIYDKFDTTFDALFEGLGKALSEYKIFFRGKEIDRNSTVATLEDIHEGDSIYASEGYGVPFRFLRFKKVTTDYFWCNSGNYPDGICFVPTQDIRLFGFSTYSSPKKDSYEMKYRIKIDGTEVEEDTVMCSGWEDEHYYRFRLQRVYPVSKEQKIDITVWIAESMSSHTNVETYHGNDGYTYHEVENEHKGLFKVESGSESGNGTSVYSGQIPEILYFM